MTDFSFTTTVPVRYRDLDPMGHVNNAVHATYAEQARVEYLGRVLDVDPAEFRFVLANLELDYRRPVTTETAVTVAMGTTAVGESSVTLAHEVRADGAVASTGEATIVHVGSGRTSEPLREPWRRAFEGELTRED